MPQPELTSADLAALDKAIAQTSLYNFLHQAWPYFDPSEFIGGWHLGAIAEHLTAINDGEIRRLLINIPPRHCKTLLVAVAWPVWTWIQDKQRGYPLRGPGVRFLCASYGATKAQADGVTARRLIGSAWFQERWADRVKISNPDNQEQYQNTAGGYRISTGIPESLGKGGAIKIVDDPHKTDEVESKDVLAGQIKAYDEVWRTRSNDPKFGAEVIIMQRLGHTDLSAHVLEDDDTVHLCLPARFEEGRRCVTVIGFQDPRERDGELLWPERFNDAWARQQETDVKPYAWAGQYQQRPEVRGGEIIKREWWNIYGPDDPIAVKLKFPPFQYLLGILDTALTDDRGNDPSAMMVLGVWEHPETGFQQVMLVNAWHRWLQINDLAHQVKHTCDRYHVDRLIIENKAAGHSIYQELRRLWARVDWGIDMVDPGRGSTKNSKVTRAHSVTHIFEEGMMHRPNTDWAQMVEDEAAAFPRAAHDDLVDCLVHGIRFLRDMGLLSRKVEQRQLERDREQYKSPSETRPLYAA